MTLKSVYLDYNASAPALPSVFKALQAFIESQGNPSSIHHHGRLMRKKIEDVRKNISRALNTLNHEVYFTSGATEANQIVLNTFFAKNGRVLTLATEHDSVLNNAPHGIKLPVNTQGIVCLVSLENELKRFQGIPTLVSIMAANNETGVIQPLDKISDLCLRYNAFFHSDASQALGRISLNLMDFQVDYLTLSAHKIGGLPGVGALLARKGTPLNPLYAGGGQEQGMRPGTHNTLGIIAFGHALQDVLAFDWKSIEVLRTQLEKTLTRQDSEVTIASSNSPRLPNTTCISMPGVSSETQVIALDLEGFSVSAGAACSSGKVKASHVLKSMGISEEKTKTFIRISLCPTTTLEDIQAFIKAWTTLYHRHHPGDSPL